MSTPKRIRGAPYLYPNRVRELRLKLGLTQAELGLRADVERSHISRIERGFWRPSYPVQVRLAAALAAGREYVFD